MKSIRKDGKKAIIVKDINTDLDFKKIKESGIDIIIYKVQCGVNWQKKQLLNKKEEAENKGLLVGICSEFDNERSANLQGMLFSNIINKVKPKIYPIIEVKKNNNLSKKAFSDKCLKCFDLIKQNIDMDCIIKSEVKFANENLDIRFRDKMFWAVDFDKNKPNNSTIWREWTCFSYSSKYTIDGNDLSFEISEVKELIIIVPQCNCGHCENHGEEIKKCSSMPGFIQGEIVSKLQEQLNIQFKADLEINGCFTEETLEKCILIMRSASGPITKIVQTRLVANGYDVGRTGIDGFYGDNTIQAVKKFQKDHKIQPFGVVNTATWKELFIKR